MAKFKNRKLFMIVILMYSGMVDFSELRNKPVIDADGRNIGILKDLVFIDGEDYAEISHLIYLSEDRYRKKISWRFVKELKKKEEDKGITVYLNEPVNDINPVFEQGNEFLVGNLVDKQIVDIHGMKVVRINDVVLGKVDSKFCVVAVGVGTKSLVRRLGIEKLVRFAPKIEEHIIPWQSVEPLEEGLHKIHIKYQKDKIADLHPSDIADIMEDLTHKERVLIFNSLDKEKAARTLVESEPNVQSSFFKNLKMNRITEILETIPSNHAADILSLMSRTKAEQLLKCIHPEIAKKIREILNYPRESAGALMSTNFVVIPKDYTAQETITLLRKLRPSPERTYHLYVVDKANHLLGVLSTRALLTAPPSKMVSKFMRKEVVKIKLDAQKEDITNALAKYSLFVLPVVDENNVIKGVVKADDVLTEIMPESWKKRVFMIKKAGYKK